jgi:hypothetical protein
MRMIAHSVVVLFFILPLSVLAGSKAYVPTSIQVVDEGGNTIISTSTPLVPKEVPRILFSTPSVCLPFLQDSVDAPIVTRSFGAEHPLRTRMESQEANLQTLVARLSFAPHLSRTAAESFKNNILMEWTHSTSTAVLDCLSLLVKEFQTQNETHMDTTIDEVARIIHGLRYANRYSDTTAIEIPKDTQEALFAGDLLLLTCPSCLSLSMRANVAELSFLLPVKLFGWVEQGAKISVHISANSVSVDNPWWLALSSHRLSLLMRDFQEAPQGEGGVTGMFMRTQYIVTRITQ